MSRTPRRSSFCSRCRLLVESNRRRWKGLVALEALGLAIAIPLGYFWAVVLLDEYVQLPRAGRFLASLGLVAGIVWSARHLLATLEAHALHRRSSRPRDGTADCGRGAESPYQRLSAGTSSRSRLSRAQRRGHSGDVDILRQFHLEQASQQRPALLRAGLACAIVLIGLIMWVWDADLFSRAAARILMPLAHIEPAYRTTLKVREPGDVERAGDVPLRIVIEGERPRSLVLYRTAQGKRSSEVIPVATNDEAVTYMVKDVLVDTDYAVRGGDFTSPTYRITVPRRAGFARLRITYQYPEYSGLTSRSVESASGELEGLQGTRAQMLFHFDQPIDAVKLIPDVLQSGSAEPVVLPQGDNNTFSTELVLDNLQGLPAGR